MVEKNDDVLIWSYELMNVFSKHTIQETLELKNFTHQTLKSGFINT